MTLHSYIRSAHFEGRGVAFDAFDLAQLAYAGDIEIRSDDAHQARVVLHDKRRSLGHYHAAFVRAYDLTGYAPNARLRDRAASQHAVLAELFSVLPIPTLNPFRAPYRGISKLFHATSVAQRLGWPIPRSCLTNSPAAAQDFVAGCATGSIFKGASTHKTYASLYDVDSHDARLELLRACPVLFQERIVGQNVRIYVIGDRVIGRRTDSAMIDHRLDTNPEIGPKDIPAAIASGCSRLSALLETPMLGIDFKIQAETGIWFFLEANTMTQYTREDVRLGGAITRAIVAWLTQSR